MAHRRKTKRHTKRTHRRMSGVPKKTRTMIWYASIAAGFLFRQKVNDLIDKVTGTLDPKIVGVIEAILGYAIPKYVLDNMVTRIIGGLLIGAGLGRELKAFGVLSGFRDMKVITGGGYYDPNSMYGTKKIAGTERPVPLSTAYKNMNTLSVINGAIGESGTGTGAATPF